MHLILWVLTTANLYCQRCCYCLPLRSLLEALKIVKATMTTRILIERTVAAYFSKSKGEGVGIACKCFQMLLVRKYNRAFIFFEENLIGSNV